MRDVHLISLPQHDFVHPKVVIGRFLVMRGSTSLLKNILPALSAGLWLFAVPSTSSAQTKKEDVAGQYVCTEASVAGKAVTCTAAPLSLKSDGKF